MATIASAKAKLAAKIPTMPRNYNESMGSFLGISAGQVGSSPAGRAYAAKIDGTMPDRWERNLKRAFQA